MKYLFMLLTVATINVSADSKWRPNERFLYAIRYVESSHGKFVYGDHGESLGDFQMSEAAWTDVSAWRKAKGMRAYSYKKNALNKKINRLYATDYFTILHEELQRALKRPPTHSELYAAYNMGLGSFAECDYQLGRVNPTTAARCRQIKLIMKSER